MKAGFGRLDMTPPLGTPLAGYYEQRLATGVRDSLSLNAIALSDGEHTAVVITADMDSYKNRMDTKPVRKTVSLPHWMVEGAEKKGLSLSKVLQESLSLRLAD